MSNFFYTSAQQFSVKKAMEPLYSDEAIVQFSDRQEIERFFDSAVKTSSNLEPINQISKYIAPTYCRRHLKSRPQLSSQERMDYMFSEIDNGNARVILKNDSFKLKHRTDTLPKGQGDINPIDTFDLKKFIEIQVAQLKKAYSKIVPVSFSFLETVYQYDENSIGAVPAILDLSSIKEHSTGWKDWDNSFEYGMLGVAKALIVFDLALATNLSESKFLAAAAGYILEGVKCQYNITGRSILYRKWFGSFSIRFNLKLWQHEIAWIKYNKSGQNERMLFEFKRADRVLSDKKVLFSVPPKNFCPGLSGDDFLAEYKKGIIPPEHDVMSPIPIN